MENKEKTDQSQPYRKELAHGSPLQSSCDSRKQYLISSVCKMWTLLKVGRSFITLYREKAVSWHKKHSWLPKRKDEPMDRPLWTICSTSLAPLAWKSTSPSWNLPRMVIHQKTFLVLYCAHFCTVHKMVDGRVRAKNKMLCLSGDGARVVSLAPAVFVQSTS